MTIHQPSSQIFSLLDNILFMKEGRVLYSGPVQDILYFYSSKGFLLPENYNPSDFVMEVCQAESLKSLESKGLVMKMPLEFLGMNDNGFSSAKLNGSPTLRSNSMNSDTTVVALPLSFDIEDGLELELRCNSVATEEDDKERQIQPKTLFTCSDDGQSIASHSENETEEGSDSNNNTNPMMAIDEKDFQFQFESSFLKQIQFLLKREYLKFTRDKLLLRIRFIFTLVVNLLAGLIFFSIGRAEYSNPNTFTSHFGAMILLLMFALISSAQTVVLSFPMERPMMLREYINGTYDIKAYFASKLLMDIPLIFIQMLLGYSISYFLIGLQGKFIYLVLISWGLGVVSASLATALGCLVPDAKRVTELVPLLYIPQLLFAGFLIRTSQMPFFIRWAQYLCSLKYAVNLILLNEFRVTSESCSKSPESRHQCESLLAINDVNPAYYYHYIVVLIALAIGFRFIGGLVLYQRAKQFH
jgi:ABC-type multidrug transport system permease subunit